MHYWDKLELTVSSLAVVPKGWQVNGPSPCLRVGCAVTIFLRRLVGREYALIYFYVRLGWALSLEGSLNVPGIRFADDDLGARRSGPAAKLSWNTVLRKASSAGTGEVLAACNTCNGAAGSWSQTPCFFPL